MDEDFRKAALDYHRLPRPGKLSVEPTKRMATQRDLALAYSPGVAAACEAIVADPAAARELTARGNLVAVITNGTAVLGLGNIGPLAGKPVMEGKAVLFKKFAGIDVFDLEVDADEIDRSATSSPRWSRPSAASTWRTSRRRSASSSSASLRERMNIPVFHDDQHGTAIVCAAAILNGLVLQGKELTDVKLVTSGAGAAALACVDLLVSMGLPVDNVTLTDIKGVVYAGRDDDMAAQHGPLRPRHRRAHPARGAGRRRRVPRPVGAHVFKPEWLPLLADKPLILALANPDPEIVPEAVRERPRPTRSWPPAARTTPTRSTTSSASPSSSAAPSTSTPPRSTRR